jgi:carbonic anhydrase
MKFVTAINCMDGRVQLPAIEWMKRKYNAEYVDMITEPGPIKILDENENTCLIESIKNRIDVSVNKHLSKVIAIIGHYDCTGNPVEKDIQIKQIKSSIKLVSSWNFNTDIIGLWIDENWEASIVE